MLIINLVRCEIFGLFLVRASVDALELGGFQSFSDRIPPVAAHHLERIA